MARISRAKRLADKHAYFAADFNTIWEATQSERRQALADRRFYSIAGAQFEDELGSQTANTPRFEFNKVHQSVIRVFSEYRNNRISVMFRPDDGDSSSETAEFLTGRYRADEQKSTAKEAYDNGFEEAAGGGMGAWRYACVAADDEDADDYESVDDESKVRIGIEPIFDADVSVYFDLDAKRYDKADSVRCYVITAYSRAGYVKAYPDSSVSSWQVPRLSTFFDWCTPDVIYVAEVFEVEKKGIVLHVYRSTLTEDEKELDDDDIKDEQAVADLVALGYVHIRDEKIKRRKVHKYIMNGVEILKDCGYIPGRCIPVVPVYGKRWFVDNIERFMGQVRLAKDLQRLLNMMISRLGELNSLTPYEVPILTPDQVKGHTTAWAEGNVKRHPYRLVNPLKDAQGNIIATGPIGFIKPPDVPPALAALLSVAAGGIDDLTGGAAAQEKDIGSNISGKAVELISKRIDMQSFIYTDNMAKSMVRGGQIWLSMKKDLTPEDEHKEPIIKPDGTQEFVPVMAPTMNKDGQSVLSNDPNAGRFGVWSDVGPSFSSRRDATVAALMNLMQTVAAADPQMATVLASTAVMNMDGEGLEELRDYLRKKLVAMGAVEPTDDEKKEAEQAAANKPPDPNAEFLMAEAGKSRALGGKAQADTLVSLSKARNLAADTNLKQEQSHQTIVDTTLTLHEAANPVLPAGGAAPAAAPAPEPATV